ncbi:MAG: hypothetical protein U9P88_02595 [Patescibacteria group bacterium]|nr:hypothetical protein [Patescibacteria group bacterium]
MNNNEEMENKEYTREEEEKNKKIETEKAEKRKKFLEKIRLRSENKQEGEKETIFEKPVEKSEEIWFKQKEEKPEKKENVSLKTVKEVYRPLPIAPSPKQKFYVRALTIAIIVALFGLIASFWYWHIEPQDEPEPTQPEEQTPQEPEPIAPPSLISTSEEKMVEFDASQTLSSALYSFLLRKDLSGYGFIRVLIKDREKNTILGFAEFCKELEVQIPENFYNKIDNDFTLFVYSSPYASEGSNRLGFIAKINEKENLSKVLRNWEPTMEKDFENFSILMGKLKPSSNLHFKEAKYKNEYFRYISFPPKNSGVCYGIMDDYLIFTSSGESMLRMFDKLKGEF